MSLVSTSGWDFLIGSLQEEIDVSLQLLKQKLFVLAQEGASVMLFCQLPPRAPSCCVKLKSFLFILSLDITENYCWCLGHRMCSRVSSLVSVTTHHCGNPSPFSVSDSGYDSPAIQPCLYEITSSISFRLAILSTLWWSAVRMHQVCGEVATCRLLPFRPYLCHWWDVPTYHKRINLI